jgi:5-methylcytosine-specific restriction endonuclease McrA
MTHVPMRPCGICSQPCPGGNCPKPGHAKKGAYRPNRPSIVTGTYRGDWPRIRAAALQAAQFRCVYCANAVATTGDHVVPRGKGGRTELANAVGCCRTCNTSKGNRTLREWVASGRAPLPALQLLAARIRSDLPV